MRGTHLCWYSLQLLNGKFFFEVYVDCGKRTVWLETVMTIGVTLYHET